MTLFRYLNDDIFMVFSGSNRHLYEGAILSLYERYFAETVSFPTRSEILHHLYETLRNNPRLWSDEESLRGLPDLMSKNRRRVRRMAAKAETTAADPVLAQARHIYVRLIECGWVEEENFGLKTTVDMPTGALLLADTLRRMRQGIDERLGGVVIEIRNALLMARDNAAQNAQGLHRARQNADNFVRSLRAILSSLKQIQRDIMASSSLEERLASLFDDFISKLMLKDFFQAIHSTSHPYRFKGEILDIVQELKRSSMAIDLMAKSYYEAGISPSHAEGIAEVESDLISIELTFERVGEMFDRITQFRRQLEARLRNTVTYAERGRRGFIERAEILMHRLDIVATPTSPKKGDPVVPSLLMTPLPAIAQHLLAEPRELPKPVAPPALRARIKDPVFEALKKLKRDYFTRLNPEPRKVLRFLEKQVPPHGRSEARWIRIESIDDFIAFDLVRRSVRSPDPMVAAHFSFARLHDTEPHDSEWLTCENFEIRRLDDHVTLETA